MYHAIVREPLPVADWSFVTEQQFREQTAYLEHHFEVVSLTEALGRLHSGEVKGPTAVITFDDGYQNTHDVAFPILMELGLPATVFLVTGLIGTDETLWFCRLNRALTKTDQQSFLWEGVNYDTSTLEAKAVTSARLQARLKRFDHDMLLTAIADIVRTLGDEPNCRVEPDSPYRMLDGEAIASMSQSGLVEFGAHTVTHPILTRVGQERRRREIECSVHEIQQMTGRPCTVFAYPNGEPNDYNAEVTSVLEAAGISAAVTTITGPNTASTPAMELRRYGIGADVTMPTFECLVHHIFSTVKAFAKTVSIRR